LKAGPIAKSSFVVISNTATLADAKDAMTIQTNTSGTTCEHAFVTVPNSRVVIGWISNDIINEKSQA